MEAMDRLSQQPGRDRAAAAEARYNLEHRDYFYANSGPMAQMSSLGQMARIQVFGPMAHFFSLLADD